MLPPKSFLKTATFAILAASLALSGCSSTGSSSNNSPETKAAAEKAVPKEAASKKEAFAKKAATVEVSQKEVSQKEAAAKEASLETDRSKQHVTRTGEVYLMRGLLNVFSRGMDDIAARMRAKGFDAISYNHSNWQAYADDIIARSKSGKVSYPIIIMGHSLGGNAAPQMANYLVDRGIKVDLVVAFDPTEHQIVGPNVKTVINYHLPNGRNTFDKGRGFNGSLQNVNVSDIAGIEHTNVEKNNGLQNKSIDRAVKLTSVLKSDKRKVASNRKKSKAS